jgi:PleD family two-component response regulator
MGIAALPNHGPGVQKAVSAADTALYQAKRQGRDQIVVASLITHGE